MMGGSRRDDGLALLIVVVLVIGGVVLYWTARLAWGLLSEAFLVYREMGFADTSSGKALRWALAVLVGVLILGSLAAALLPFTTGVDLTAMAWAFFGWATTVGICGSRGRSLRGDPGVVDSYLSYGRNGGSKSG